MTDPIIPPPPPARAWLGVLFSLFVPGFGLIRAGRIVRGICWFVAIQAIGILTVLFIIWRAIPTWGALVAMCLAIAVQIVMLVDSYRPGRLTLGLFVIFMLGCAAILLVPLPAQWIARAFKVPTAAMEPTFQGASKGTPDHIIIDRLTYRLSEPGRGDLVVFSTKGISGIPEEASLYVKRVAGLPGEKIELRDGHVFANGRKLTEQDGIPPFFYVPTSHESYNVPEGEYFMLGDNSRNSFDSRYWGCVPRHNLVGRVSRIYYPFSRAGVPR
jgi:signal peptidase I